MPVFVANQLRMIFSVDQFDDLEVVAFDVDLRGRSGKLDAASTAFQAMHGTARR
jgi:hypothetical protein